ncbi:mitochondrial cardiolipin hydrolase-like [Trichogramma pretiosum]|uniref:mitochondrial cardiolipin hydrolase-like n=1 Tax=Trichogramma pretiosum TaxID=7493 RepID=UPI0006C9A2C8|nr:mitochondrial cardiolipin hydrolase-like [Trichogramma pretiosum]XP_014223918.1 mitochondrial cardiolipin hydrolase-like [Trichogramma pretiosum]XP_023316240.1 mitochondrial cardiolipin hydrolase-like [Trichogramma pretiosum]
MSAITFSNSYRNYIISIIGLACATKVYQLLYNKSKSKQANDVETTDPEIEEVLLFSDEAIECRKHMFEVEGCDSPHCPADNLAKIVNYMSSAKKSIDICVHFITCNSIGNAIFDTIKRGVIVRVITDEESSKNYSSLSIKFMRANCEVKANKFKENFMHHKFAVIDKKILISGSANWTMQAFYGNYENVIITNDKVMVKSFLTEFNYLWETLPQFHIN